MIPSSGRPMGLRNAGGPRVAPFVGRGLAVLLGLLASGSVRAGSNYWESVGPDGGVVIALAVDPSTPTTIYAGVSAGLYKSVDGGAHWRGSGSGLGAPQVVALAIDPTAPSVLYAGTRRFGAFKSTDGGGTWAAANTGLTAKNVWALVVDPQDSRNVYAGTEAGIFRSHDGGASWAAANAGLPADTVFALAIDPASSGTLYAGMNSSGVYRSSDGAGTWSAAAAGLTQSQIFSLAIDPVHPSNVYAGTALGAFRSTDGASTWSAAGLSNEAIVALAVDPTTPSRVYAGDADAGVLRSEDGGQDWVPAGAGLPGYGVNALAIDPTATGNVYAGARSGVFKTTDHGDGWASSSANLRALTPLSLAVDPSSPSTVYAGTNAGLFETLDRGVTWTHPTNGLGEVHVYALLIVPGSPTKIFAGADGGVFVSTDGAATWTSPLSADFVLALAIDPAAPSTIYAGGSTADSTQGFVYQSLDGGATWASYGTANPPLPPVNALAVPPAGSTASVYAGTDMGGYGAILQGGSVQWLGAKNLATLTIFSIAIDPLTTSTVYAGTNAGLWKSLDAGKSWTQIDPTTSGLQAAQIFALLFDPAATGTLYAGTATGFYESTDGGARWTGLYDGVGATRMFSIAAGPPPILYAGVVGASVFQYGKPNLTPCFPGPYALCLNNGRFKVTASWRTADGRSGAGQRVALTGDTGYFWFFTNTNVELVVKVLDGTGVNGHFWVFYGALSNVQYTITVFDTHTGFQKMYVNPQGQLASVADTTAFTPTGAPTGVAGAAGVGPPTAEHPAVTADACAADAATLCLNSGRFRVDVSWRTSDGRSGSGQAVPLSGDTGYFWFFWSANVELVVKVLDGRPVNGHFWVFYGALSNVAYTITVTDTQTGIAKPYANPQGTLASVADTAAF